MRSLLLRPLALPALVALLLAAFPASAIDVSPSAVPPHDESVLHGTLPNGMAYYVRRNEKPENRVELRLALKVGSIQETEEERGLAHFLEHMNFNGSKNFKPGELIPWLESIGTRFGADSNAYTSYDETVYMLQIPTDKEGALEKGLLVMSDWAGGATLDAAEIDKERGVVLDELRRGKGAGKRIREKQDQLTFQGSRYAERLPIGLESVVTSASHDTVRGFYRRWYRPDAMAIIVVGDIDAKQMEERVKTVFGALPKPDAPTTIPEWPVPAHDETLYSVESDKELTSSRVQLVFKHAADRTRTVGDLRRDAVRQVAAGLLAQRLSERARNADPPFLGAGAFVGTRVKTLTTLTLSAAAKDGTVPVAARALAEELERARKHGFVAAELDRTKASVLAGAETRLKEAAQQRSDERVGGIVGAFLEDQVLTSDEYDYELTKALMPGITLDEVNAAIRSLSDSSSRVVLVQVPQKDGLAAPTVDELKAAIEPAGGFEVAAYVDDLAGKKLVDFEPKAGSVVSRRELPEVGAEEITLANGLRVVLKPTDFRADQVLLRGLALEGASAFGPARFDAAIRADSLASSSGVADFTATQLSKYLQAQGVIAGAGPGVSRLTRSFSGQARPQDVEIMLQLVHLYFARPAFRAEAFQRMVDSEVESLRNEMNSPAGVYGRAVDEELYGGHWLFRPDRVETVTALKMSDIEQAYREMFDDASEWTFILVGNIDRAAHLPLLEKWLGSIPTTSSEPRVVASPTWKDLRIGFPPGKTRREVRKGIEDQARTLFTWPTETQLDPQAEFDVDAATDLLEIRLRERLREDLGETYGVGVGYSSLQPYQGLGRVSVSWTSAPGPREQMVEIVKRTMREMRSSMPSDEDVAKLREMRYNSLAEAVKENGYWLNQLQRCSLLGREPRTILEQRGRIDALTPQRLRAAIRKWFDLGTTLEVFLLPEKAAATASTPAPASAAPAAAAARAASGG